MEIIAGKITVMGEDGFTIFAPYRNMDRACLRQYGAVEIGLPDARKISCEQRKKAWALLSEIGQWQGEQPDHVNQHFKLRFVMDSMKDLRRRIFSLSDCDVTTAREYIDYLVQFAIEWAVPTKVPLRELCEDIERYVFMCLINHTCAVCGIPGADLHHVDRVGMGRNRQTIPQIGMRCMSLCRQHHGELHSMGDPSFLEKYHLEPVEMTKEIGRAYNLSKKSVEAAT